MSIYILISIIALLAIVFIWVSARKRLQKPPSQLATLSFLLVIAGIAFGDNNRVIGYSLITLGVALAVIDITRKQNIKNPQN